MNTKRVVAIVVTVPLLYIGVTAVMQKVKTTKDVSAVKSARERAMVAMDQQIADQLAAFKSAGIAYAPKVSSKVDVCYINHADAGFNIHSWYQDCYLRSLSGFEVSDAREEVIKKLSNLPSQIGSVYVPDPSFSFGKCKLIAREVVEIARYRPANTQAQSSDCGIPSQVMNFDSVRGPILLEKDLAVHDFNRFNESDISGSSNQIWLINENHYYHQDLGCGLGFIFCSKPRSQPVQAR